MTATDANGMRVVSTKEEKGPPSLASQGRAWCSCPDCGHVWIARQPILARTMACAEACLRCGRVRKLSEVIDSHPKSVLN